MYPRFPKVHAFTRMTLNIKSIVRLATMRRAEAMNGSGELKFTKSRNGIIPNLEQYGKACSHGSGQSYQRTASIPKWFTDSGHHKTSGCAPSSHYAQQYARHVGKRRNQHTHHYEKTMARIHLHLQTAQRNHTEAVCYSTLLNTMPPTASLGAGVHCHSPNA